MFKNNDEIISRIERYYNIYFDNFDDIPRDIIHSAIERYRHNHNSLLNKYFVKDHFNVNHADQLSMMMYEICRLLHMNNLIKYADEIYLLNKYLFSIDLHSEIVLPVHYFLAHALGTVLGRAQYSDGLVVGQNVTVGNNRGIYPVFSGSCELNAGCCVLGKSNIGNNVIIGAGCIVIDRDIPDNKVVYFSYADGFVVKENERDVMEMYFRSCS